MAIVEGSWRTLLTNAVGDDCAGRAELSNAQSSVESSTPDARDDEDDVGERCWRMLLTNAVDECC